MFSARSVLIGVVAAIAVLSSPVNGHGQLTRPQPTFNGYGGGYPSVIQSSVLQGQFVGPPDTNADSFDKAFRAQKKSSLKDFILQNQDTSKGSASGGTADCGFSKPNGAAQALPDSLQWGTGFIHPGPCEAWCDNEIVVPYTANCWKTFAGGSVPYDKAKCVGKSRLTFYWLGVHGPPWQVYINCVPLSGASSGGGGGNSNAGNSNSGGGTTTTTNNNNNNGSSGNNKNNGSNKNSNSNSNNQNNNNNGNRNAGSTGTSNLNFGALGSNNSGNNAKVSGWWNGKRSLRL